MQYENLLSSLIDSKNKELWDFCSSNAVMDLELSEKMNMVRFLNRGNILYLSTHLT